MIEKDLTMIEILGIAIQAEIASYKMYRKIAREVRNSTSRDRFTTLAREEQSHQLMLENLYRKSGGKISISLPKKNLKVTKLEIKGSSPIDIIQTAIEKEKETRKFYLEAFKKATDKSGRFILQYLADFEQNHQRILEHEFKTLTEYPMWWDYEGPGIQFIGP
ncbi:MAG: ferritin family protein [Acidobacteriota bacterium]